MCFLKKWINQISQKEDKAQINKTVTRKRDIITDIIEIQKTLKIYQFKNPYFTKYKCLKENEFVDVYDVQKCNQNKITYTDL